MTAVGGIDVLNVGMGDMKITFDRHDEAERESARAMIEHMIRRGFAIMVALPGRGGRHTRVEKFDPAKGTYILRLSPDQVALLDNDVDGLPAVELHEGVPRETSMSDALAELRAELKRDKAELLALIEKRDGDRIEVPARRARATAIGRSAGG